MEKVNGRYLVRLNAFSRNLLLSALSTCKFTLLHRDHPFAAIIEEHGLIDPDLFASLFQRLKNAENTDMLEFSLEDEILIYTALDITCKFFLTELSDDMKRISMNFGEGMGKDFNEVRNTLIRGAQFVRDGLRTTLADSEAFQDRVELLDLALKVD